MTTALPRNASTQDDPDQTKPSENHAPRRSRRSHWQWARLAALIGTAVFAGLIVARLGVGLLQPHLYAGTVLQSPTPSPEMDGLVLGNGEPMDMATFEGDVVLMYFGYTNCPDVCPTTLSTAARLREELSEQDRERVHVIMVSVDPERDPLGTLQSYVEFFDDDFLALGGAAEAIDRAAAQYGIYYAFSEPEADGSYTVDHTASLLGIGPDGHLRVVWGPDVDPNAFGADVRELLDS